MTPSEHAARLKECVAAGEAMDDTRAALTGTQHNNNQPMRKLAIRQECVFYDSALDARPSLAYALERLEKLEALKAAVRKFKAHEELINQHGLKEHILKRFELLEHLYSLAALESK